MSSRLFIHATNIHQGGGYSLLSALLKAMPSRTKSVFALDARMAIPDDLILSTQVKRVMPSVAQRFLAERWLAHNVACEDTVLCLGNLPPLFKLRGRVVVFVQNRYLIENIKLNRFPLKVRLRLEIERLWISAAMLNANEFVVQTPSMKKLLEQKTQGNVPVRILPFVSEPNGYTRNASHSEEHRATQFDFVYVASGEPHKNHLLLVEAWCLLAEEGLFPSLCLTLDRVRFAGLCREIEVSQRQYDLNLENMGELSHREVLALYEKAGAAIYPSTFESFGLPLIEARQAGLPVLASELDFVRDALDPEQTFDPASSRSIARAVKRFMGIDEPPLPLLNAMQFLTAIMGKAI